MTYWVDQTLFALNWVSQERFLLALLSASDRSFNLGVADKPLICQQTFSYLPQYCSSKVCLEMKPNSVSSTDGWPLSVSGCITHLNNYTGQNGVI